MVTLPTWLNRWIGLLVCCLVLVRCVQAEEPMPVTLGVSMPLSGAMSVYGQDAVAGVRMAVDELNQQQLHIGGRLVRWQLDVQDDQGDPKQATVIAQKFSDAKVSGVVGPIVSGCSNAAAAIYERAQIPTMNPGATADSLARRDRRMFHRVLANDTAIGGALIEYVLKQFKPHRVAIVDDRSQFGQLVADQFAQGMHRAGVEVVQREYTNDKAVDFRAILTRIRSSHPDLLYFGGYYAQGGPMLRQMLELGMDVPMVGGDALCVGEMAKLAGDAVSHLTCANSGAPIDSSAAGRSWHQRFKRQFDPTVYQIFAPYGYDSAMVLAHAMVKAGSAEPQRYLPRLRDIGWKGVTHPDIRFTDQGNLLKPMVTISTFRDDVKTTLEVISTGGG